MTTESAVTPVCYCPYCNHKIDRASDSRNDVSVCIYCTGILIFKDDMTVREAGVGEQMDIEKWPEVQAIQQAIRFTKAKLS